MLEMLKNDENSKPINKAIKAAFTVIFGFGASQIIRLAGNIVLTRLLVPELFGVMTISRLFVTMIALFADIGTWPATMRSKRSNDPNFLNTAWTLDQIRGVALAVICISLAWPVSLFYKEPILFPVTIFISFLNIPGALKSTSLMRLQKAMEQRILTKIEILTQLVSLATMIILAYFLRNIWALLIGELVGVVFNTVWSHILNREMPNRFYLERDAIKEILSFGKWIFLSTAIMAMATQADRMILGKLFPMAWIGVYGIALTFSSLPKEVINRLSDKVLYPFLTYYSHLPRDEFRKKIKLPRGKLLPILAVLFGIFACYSDFIIRILYDQRYGEAAWILPMLSIGMWPLIMVESIDSALLSIGKPKYATMANLSKFIYMLAAVPLGYFLGGTFGAVLAVMLNDLPSYITINFGLKREGLSLLRQDLFATIIFISVVLLMLVIRILIGLGLPGEEEFRAVNQLISFFN